MLMLIKKKKKKVVTHHDWQLPLTPIGVGEVYGQDHDTVAPQTFRFAGIWSNQSIGTNHNFDAWWQTVRTNFYGKDD